MDFHFEVKDKRLRDMLEKKAKENHITVDQQIWAYINRGLMGDGWNEDVFKKLHSEKFLNDVSEALGFD